MKGADHVLEVQVHAEDIRHGVRYFFLSRGQLVAVGLGALLLLGLFLGSIILLPGVVSRILAQREYDRLRTVRAQQGERLELLTVRLERLREETASMRQRMEKIHLAYGLSEEESLGQGGFPFEEQAVPDSIYAGTIAQGGRLERDVREQMHVLEAFLNEVRDFEEHHREQVHTTPSTSPLEGYDFVLTSPFGTRRNPFTKARDFHAGIDLAAPSGTPIYAPSDGVVVFAGRYDLRRSVSWWRYGNLVVLRHGDRFITLFGHCREVEVRSGQTVSQGDRIATVGNTGWSTSPHLHYEVRRLDESTGEYRSVDPRIYILNHEWREEEKLLVRAREAPDSGRVEPLPKHFSRP
ncbi:MAG: M23 family metallopeptidase [Thermoanaerobaculia bacterium]|nr:M23 family metallopeptidase [Thermoanaerobaculia bacterium]